MNDPTKWELDGRTLKVGDVFTSEDLDAFRLLMTGLNEAKRQNAAWMAAARLVLTESNGVFDNEWRRPDGTAIPEYPIASFCEAIKALDALYSKTTHSTGGDLPR